MQKQLAAHLAVSDGLVTNVVASSLGVTARQLEGLVRRGELERVHRGVYRSTIVPPTQRQRWLAGLLAVGDGAALSHRSALAAHGAPNFSCSLVEVTVRSSALPVRAGVLAHRSISLPASDVERVNGLTVTTKERTLIDACTVLPAALVVRFVEHWVANRMLRLDAVFERIGGLRTQPGARALEGALEARTLVPVVADSPAEHRLGVLLVKAGLEPRHHVLVTTGSGCTYELDWAFPEVQVGLELDGYGVHMRSVQTFDHDRFRRNQLENEGWQILNFTERQVRRTPETVLRQVRTAIARRGVHLHRA